MTVLKFIFTISMLTTNIGVVSMQEPYASRDDLSLASPNIFKANRDMLGEVALSKDSKDTENKESSNDLKRERGKAPQWMIDIMKIRQDLFLQVIEPIIVFMLGPVDPTLPFSPRYKQTQSLLYVHNNIINNSSSNSNNSSWNSEEQSNSSMSTNQPKRYSSSITGDLESTLYTENYPSNQHRRLGYLPDFVENKLSDASYFQETSMSFATFTMLFFIMSCILMVFLNCFYHNQKTSPLFISPRRHRLPKLVPPPLPVNGFFSWVKIILFLSDEEIINRIGFDSLIFLRFHRLALRCIVKMSVFSFIVLLPINFTGGESYNFGNDIKDYVGGLVFTDFLRFTMANVSGGSPRLWVHCFAAYLLTGIVVRELLAEYNAFHNIRHRYLLSKETHLRTVLVSNIPRHLRSAKKITTYFKNVYPDAVKSVSIAQNLLRLESLVDSRTKILAEIERELLVLCRNEKRKLVNLSGWDRYKVTCSWWNLMEIASCFDSAQDRMSKLYNKLEDINDRIEKEQTRRRRIMKKLDKMEASEGSDEIDYYLASPYVNDPDQKKTVGMQHQVHHNEVVPISKVTAGRPKNPGRPLRDNFSYQPPSFKAASSSSSLGEDDESIRLANNLPNATHGTSAINGDPWPKEKSKGPYQRSPLRESEVDEKNSSDASAQVESDNTDPKKKDRMSKLRAFSRAKQAIKRYSRIARAPYIFNRSKNSDSQRYFETTENSASSLPNDLFENHTNEVTDKAFVVMRTFTASTIAIQSMHSSRPGAMQVTTAPEPRDILWENIYVSKGARRMRSFIGDTVVMFVIVFYVVPVAIVALLVSESALISASPRLAQLDQASAIFSSAISLVQPICLVGIQQLLPPLFMQIGKAEGMIAFSEVQMRAFSRYFGFQVLNVFLVTAVGGIVFDTLAKIIETPEAAFKLLGNSLPKMSSFFISFVMMKTFLGLGVELVRIMSLVQSMTRFLLFPKSTLRAQRSVRIGMRAIDDPGWFAFHKILAQDMLVVVISVVFAVVAPLVLLPCALFCFFSRITWTHHHLYVYESVFETGGQFWPKIFRRFIFGLIISQATITGQFILKEARIEALATLALMSMTYFFLRSTRARYDQSSHTLPLEVATIMDISESQEEEILRQKNHSHGMVKNDDQYSSSTHFDVERGPGSTIGQIDPFQHAYIQPALRAASRARPEQPFPPAQLGREEKFLGQRWKGGDKILESALPPLEEETLDGSATVRLKSMSQEDRKRVDSWWEEQMQRAGKQDWLSVLSGQECGTLMIGPSGLAQNELF